MYISEPEIRILGTHHYLYHYQNASELPPPLHRTHSHDQFPLSHIPRRHDHFVHFEQMLVFVSPTIEQQWLRTIKDGWSRYHKNLFGVLLARVHFSVYVVVARLERPGKQAEDVRATTTTNSSIVRQVNTVKPSSIYSFPMSQQFSKISKKCNCYYRFCKILKGAEVNKSVRMYLYTRLPSK